MHRPAGAAAQAQPAPSSPPAPQPGATEPTAAPSPTPAPAPAPEPAEPDDDPAPGQALLRRQEQHLRRQFAQAQADLQADFTRRERDYQSKIDKLTEQLGRFTNARQDPFGAIEALGFAEADYPGLHTAFYAMTPDGQKDPKHRALAQDMLARREQVSKVDQLEKQLAEMRKAQESERQQAEARATLAAAGQQIASAVTDQSPLTKAALTKRPEQTRQTLLQVAAELWRMSGPSDDLRDDPTPAQVVQAYEGVLLAELEALGVDTAPYRKPAGAPAATKPAPAAAPTPTSNPAAAPAAPARKTRLPSSQLVAKLHEERQRRQSGV